MSELGTYTRTMVKTRVAFVSVNSHIYNVQSGSEIHLHLYYEHSYIHISVFI